MPNVKVLVVGGGGSGGSCLGGGGGAGGYQYDASFAVNIQAYTVTVGAGGASVDGNDAVAEQGNNGENSVFSTITANGGGGGGYYSLGSGSAGSNGGSGGGAAPSDSGTSSGGTGSQGNDGGDSGNPHSAGGGGGSATAGGDGTSTVGGNGGDGTQNNISGTNVYYCGGGGGSRYSGNDGSGGLGGGGAAGSTASPDGTDGTANTGGGGGGRGYAGSGTYNSGAGGSGVVIIRYLTADFGVCTGGVKTTDGADTIHTFNSSGTMTFVSSGGATPTPTPTPTLTITPTPTLTPTPTPSQTPYPFYDLKIGTTDISKFYIGTSQVSKAYLGANQIYGQVVPPPTPTPTPSPTAYYFPTVDTQVYLNLNNNTNDTSGNSNNGTGTNITYGDGLYDKYAIFNGTSSVIELTTEPVTGSNPDMTINFWFKTSSDAEQYLCYLGGSTVGSANYVYINTLGRILSDSVSTSFVVDDGNWHMATFTRTGTNEYLYVDASEKGTATASKNIGTTYKTIGANSTDTANLNGHLDDFVVEDVYWNSTKVSTVYNAEKYRYGL